jgi:hypothetical protein
VNSISVPEFTFCTSLAAFYAHFTKIKPATDFRAVLSEPGLVSGSLLWRDTVRSSRSGSVLTAIALLLFM